MTSDRGSDPENIDPSWAPLPATIGAGRYTVESLIGRGGSGEVFRAHDRLLGRAVALKVFPPGVAAEDVRRWREVRTLAGLDHDRLVRIYDVGEHETRPFFVMQLVDGHSLHVHLGVGTLDVPAMLRLGSGLASGLGHVHGRGVVHRDVKPANVLLDEAGQAYLTDFGIATRLGAAAITEAGVVLGTAAYLSPEQVRGEEVGPAADVYSLGLVLMESLTGRREYPGEVVESAVARLHRRPEPPPGIDVAVDETLRAMTADDPADRPGAAEVAVRLVALLRAHADPEPARLPAAPVATRAPVLPTRRRAHRGRSKRWGWALSGLLAVLLTFVGATLTQGGGMPAALGATLAAPRPDLPPLAPATAPPRTSRAAPVVPATEDGTPSPRRTGTTGATATTDETDPTRAPRTTTSTPTSSTPSTPSSSRTSETGPSPDTTVDQDTVDQDTPGEQDTTVDPTVDPETTADPGTTSATAPDTNSRASRGRSPASPTGATASAGQEAPERTTARGSIKVRTPAGDVAIGVPSRSGTDSPRSR